MYICPEEGGGELRGAEGFSLSLLTMASTLKAHSNLGAKEAEKN